MRINLILIIFLSVGCLYSQQEKDFSRYFKEQNVDGSFLMYDLNSNSYISFNNARTNVQFTPASTFKIFNSLVALETGVIPDESNIIKWDSVHRRIPSWNKDQDMRSAFRNSTVWFYRELARRIGEEKMLYYIDTIGYGNKDISGGIDQFWLSGSLRISQKEQIEFLKKLYNNQLPFSQRSMEIVKDIMLLEDTSGYKLRAKTGWGDQDGKDIGWFVGWYEKNNNVYIFATNIETPSPSAKNFPAARIEITIKILRELNILP
jgi:beta-lactamase class D